MISADVLVIGGGQAALRAAIAARNQGAKVVMVSKGKIGAGGSSAISDAVHSAILTDGDSAEIFYQDILRGGKQINKPELARALAEECTSRVEELQREFQVELHLERELVTPGHSFPRRCYHASSAGIAITRQLRVYAERIGVEFYEKTAVVDLLANPGHPDRSGSNGANADSDGRIVGALGVVASGGDGQVKVGQVEETKGEPVIFIAGSTIVATGGFGRLYTHSDNPADVSGEMIGIAWRHGAELQDMEFVQFYPYRLVEPVNIDLFTKLFGKGAVMRNDKGIRFLEDYPRKELETRDIVCQEMYQQGKVLLDVSQVSPQVLQAVSPRLHSLLKKGYGGELLMQPVEHYSMGGISIDEYGRTSKKGLYACGECTGGVHGANRLGGGALTESLVFGARAGSTAAMEALSPSAYPNAHIVKEAEEQWATFYSNTGFPAEGQELAVRVRKRVQELMWEKVGIERTEQGLQEACDELDALADMVRDSLPLLDMVQVARIAARSALARKESRGAHRMPEYPGERDEWRGNLIVRGEEIYFHSLVSGETVKVNA